MISESSGVYESYCPHCNVSQPPDARTCVHCGGLVMRERPKPITADGEHLWPKTLDAEGDETSPRRAGPLQLILTLAMGLLFVASYLVRACMGDE